jgi:hypothetical protein
METPHSIWSSLPENQRCVLVCADSSDGDTVGGILASWDPWRQPEDLNSHMRELTDAITSLTTAGLTAVYEGVGINPPALPLDELRRYLANPKNWWNPDLDEGFDRVLWVTTTDTGRDVARKANWLEVRKYFDRRYSDRTGG